MHVTCSHSSAFGRPFCSPSRPYLNVRAGHIRELPGSIASEEMIRAIARLIAAITPRMCVVAASTFLGTVACAQLASRIEPLDRYAGFIAEASDRFRVPARWIRVVMQIESGGNARATSRLGAMGLMQVMPGTWVQLSLRYGLGLDPFDPRDNILAGAAYLKEKHDRFGSAGFLAACHAGQLRYEQHLATGRALPSETVAYVAAVTPLLASEQRERDVAGASGVVPSRQAPLFVERAGAQ